jgi:glycosyltransferase involved in cell wall biosynthesis
MMRKKNTNTTHYKKLSIVVPAYNEENTVESLIDRVLKADSLGLEKEIVIVNDGSLDATRYILDHLPKSKGFVVIHQPRNQGKGAALRTGLQKTTGDIILIQDSDLEYNPDDYPRLLEPILSGEADVVFGSRFAGAGSHRVLYYWHYLGNKFLTTLSNMFTNLNLTDMETGYKVFTREVLDQVSGKLESNRFGFEPEITARVSKLQCRIYEVGISYFGRTYEEGKKIGLKDAFQAVYCIIRYNLFD